MHTPWSGRPSGAACAAGAAHIGSRGGGGGGWLAGRDDMPECQPTARLAVSQRADTTHSLALRLTAPSAHGGPW
eukprot:scaffold44025_cov58-Phaeocystis_antarctica.AAC.6